MLIESLKLTFAIFLPFVTGFLLVALLFLKEKCDYVLKISLSFGMGSGILALLMMILGALGITFTQKTIALSLFSLFIVFFLIFLYKSKDNSQPCCPKTIETERNLHWTALLIRSFLFLLISLNLFFVFFRAANLPVLSWDALATVAFKAKIFYFEGHLPHMNKLPHSTYPLLVPFNETWIALNLGQWSDEIIKIIFPFALISFLGITYAFLKKFTDKTWALLGCTLLLSSDLFIFHATISYRDFFLMYFNCVVIMLLILWDKTKNSSFLILASLFAGFASFTKLEGTAFFAIYLFIFLLLTFFQKTTSLKNKCVNFLKFTLPALCVLVPFNLYKILNGVLQDGVGNNDKTALKLAWSNLQLIPKVIYAFFQNIIISNNWGITWMVLLVSLVHLKKKKQKKEIYILGISILLFFALYGSVAVFTSNYYWIAGKKGDAGLSRLILHFFPLTILMIILLNYPKTEEKE